MKGSMTALVRKIKKIGPVMMDDRDELLSLIRMMTAEIMKLKKIAPPIHTNRELVELFLGRLDPDFAARVANKLAVHRLISAKLPADPSEGRNPEDMYDVDEVMDLAKQTSLEHANPFGKFLAVSAVQTTPTTAKLEEAVAKLTDSINVQAQHSKAVDQTLHTLQSFVNNQSRPAYGDQRQVERPSGAGQPNLPSMTCFYCGGQHLIKECNHVLVHLDLGLIKKVDGRLKLADGSRLPREPPGGKTARELVEALRTNVPGIVNTAKLANGPSSYQRAPNATYVQAQYGPDDDRLLQELIYKLGTEKARQYVQAREEYDADYAEWEQNFC
jgi:hypothetical protein